MSRIISVELTEELVTLADMERLKRMIAEELAKRFVERMTIMMEVRVNDE
jgi:hypothetical protein